MSLESLNMAGGVLGTAFSLLLLASITQGLQDVDILHYEKMEAVVGENVTLPCIIQSSPSLTITSVEWRKNKSRNTKLAVYTPTYGLSQFWPNVTMQIVPNGSYLHLHSVETWDSGFYICEIATFPLGSISSETELEIKDEVKLLCDAESIVEVHPGENVTISCTAFPADHYKWTKNNTLVSEIQSLELWLVTEAHSGIYTLTVNTGNKSVHKEFSITVLTATTSLRTDLQVEVSRSQSSTHLQCLSSWPPSSTSYIWFKNGRKIKEYTAPYANFTYDSADSYSCAVKGYEDFPSPSVYTPKFPFVSVSPSAEIEEGGSVTLTCSSDANPAANYTWYKKNEDSPKASGQIFNITDFRAEHSGNYYCETQNILGRSNSTLHLIVVAGSSTMTMNIIRMTVLVLMLIPVFLLSLWMSICCCP
ncbi:B-cell receptor CD22-like isoform X2 [Trematomus bernacchii]|uniref:B-cell receptor CD22-like isoform X2 n=1 Tax=Trematomus bernacchii TaxID=40690 RepID=UPI00146EB800|nr:B-cell receptor CD22-like isoform X2 [Trematomus bernacchii]